MKLPGRVEHGSFQGRTSFTEGDVLCSAFCGTFCSGIRGRHSFLILHPSTRDMHDQALTTPVLGLTQNSNICISGDLQPDYQLLL